MPSHDFELNHWSSQPLDGETAHSIRHDVRAYRRERGRNGHRFRFQTLKTLWVSTNHAVLNHTDDPAWQYWYCDGRQGWLLVDTFRTRREAQAVADAHPVPPDLVVHGSDVRDSMIVVRAGWPDAQYPDLPPKVWNIKVGCTSASTADQIISVFEHIGCRAEKAS